MKLLESDITWVEQTLKRRHVSYGLVAALVSVLVHAIVIARFPNITFGTILDAAVRKYRPPVRVERVQVAPSPAVTRPERFRVENPSLKVDLPGEAEAQKRGLDTAIIEPPTLPEEVRAGENRILGKPTAAATKSAWDPRLEILKIEERVVADRVNTSPRRFVADIPRGARAADIVAPASRGDLAGVLKGDSEDFRRIGTPDGKVDSVVLGGNPRGGAARPPAVEGASNAVSKAAEETPEEVTGAVPLEKLLRADVSTYSTIKDLKYVYCRIEIKRLGPQILPVLPKDFALMQDCSASMTEQKLHFCREGLVRCLQQVGPEDRFNVFAFRDKAEPCFPDWVKADAATLAQARQFIEGMKSEGNTDIYTSLRELLSFKRVAGRPVIGLMVSDGIPTVGVTSSPRIIAEFSRDNAGSLSVFSMGTISGANAYLLDLLSYCNRGDSLVVTRGRWEIPDALDLRAKEVARPVLADVKFRFPRSVESEAYPVLTSNLYLDRPLVLFCRCPRGTRRLVFQAVGVAGSKRCDMVFDVDLDKAPSAKEDLREEWAWQKVYYLTAEHTRGRNPEIVAEIRRTAKGYGIDVPYATTLGD